MIFISHCEIYKSCYNGISNECQMLIFQSVISNSFFSYFRYVVKHLKYAITTTNVQVSILHLST